MTDLSHLADIITDARERFTQLLMSHTSRTGVTPQIYQRYLSMQYHLTKGVQRYFMVAAAHQDLAKMRKLRRFLFDFANEEELHYLVAANDLRELGMEILPEPFDVELWHAYFTREVLTRPFVRLGAAAILENLAGTENRPILVDLLKANFLSPKNTKFLVLYQSQSITYQMKWMDFFVWQGAGGVNSESIHDECNAARRKKTRFHGAFMGWGWYYTCTRRSRTAHKSWMRSLVKPYCRRTLTIWRKGREKAQ